jgi:DNA-binding response OmpR family regulator
MLREYDGHMRALLVEDEPKMAAFIMTGLKAEHFAIDWTDQADKAVFWGKTNPYDVAIFDINLGRAGNGLDICKAIREKGKTFPIIMLSVVRDTATKVEALNLGADDYLTKPFSITELTARIRALLRREKNVVIGSTMRIADLEMDTISHTVSRGGKPLQLNKKEFALLEYLVRNQGTTLTRNMILEHVWDVNADPFTNTVDVHIRFLRAKIDEGRKKKLLKTVHGYGYKIEA